MVLTLLNEEDGICYIGDDEGKIFSAPLNEVYDVEMMAPVHWSTKLVRIPDHYKDLGDGRVDLATRDIDLVYRKEARSTVGFDPVKKTWYLYLP